MEFYFNSQWKDLTGFTGLFTNYFLRSFIIIIFCLLSLHRVKIIDAHKTNE